MLLSRTIFSIFTACILLMIVSFLFESDWRLLVWRLLGRMLLACRRRQGFAGPWKADRVFMTYGNADKTYKFEFILIQRCYKNSMKLFNRLKTIKCILHFLTAFSLNRFRLLLILQTSCHIGAVIDKNRRHTGITSLYISSMPVKRCCSELLLRIKNLKMHNIMCIVHIFMCELMYIFIWWIMD